MSVFQASSFGNTLQLPTVGCGPVPPPEPLEVDEDPEVELDDEEEEEDVEVIAPALPVVWLLPALEELCEPVPPVAP